MENVAQADVVQHQVVENPCTELLLSLLFLYIFSIQFFSFKAQLEKLPFHPSSVLGVSVSFRTPSPWICVLYSYPGLPSGAASVIIWQMVKLVSNTPVFSTVKLWLFLQPQTSGPKLMSHAGVILYLMKGPHINSVCAESHS